MALLEGPLGPLLPEHWPEFIVGIVLFGVIVLVMWKIVVPRFEKLYVARHDAIQGELDRADQAQTEAKAALAAYRQRLADAETEAARIRDAAKASGEQIQADLTHKAEQEASRIVTTARAQVEAEKAQAIESLRKDVGMMATTLAGKILGESLQDDTKVAATVDSFIDSLAEGSA